MTKLEELKAAYDAAYADYAAAEAACDDAYEARAENARAVDAANAAYDAAVAAYYDADYAYEAELNKKPEENSND
jgi:predicted lipid-binding transport protein (Tim44 family)